MNFLPLVHVIQLIASLWEDYQKFILEANDVEALLVKEMISPPWSLLTQIFNI